MGVPAVAPSHTLGRFGAGLVCYLKPCVYGLASATESPQSGNLHSEPTGCIQAQLATSNSALAAARAEVGKLQVALSTAQRELSARTREANESTQQLDARAREVNERSQEIAQLHAVIAELRQQVQAYEQQKAAATPR